MKRTILLSMSVLAALSFPASSGDIPPTRQGGKGVAGFGR